MPFIHWCPVIPLFIHPLYKCNHTGALHTSSLILCMQKVCDKTRPVDYRCRDVSFWFVTTRPKVHRWMNYLFSWLYDWWFTSSFIYFLVYEDCNWRITKLIFLIFYLLCSLVCRQKTISVRLNRATTYSIPKLF